LLICFNPNLNVTSGSSYKVIDPINFISNWCIDIAPVKERSIKKVLWKLLGLRLGVQGLSQCMSSEVPQLSAWKSQGECPSKPALAPFFYYYVFHYLYNNMTALTWELLTAVSVEYSVGEGPAWMSKHAKFMPLFNLGRGIGLKVFYNVSKDRLLDSREFMPSLTCLSFLSDSAAGESWLDQDLWGRWIQNTCCRNSGDPTVRQFGQILVKVMEWKATECYTETLCQAMEVPESQIREHRIGHIGRACVRLMAV